MSAPVSPWMWRWTLEAGVRWLEIHQRQREPICPDRRWSLGGSFWTPKMQNVRHGCTKPHPCSRPRTSDKDIQRPTTRNYQQPSCSSTQRKNIDVSLRHLSHAWEIKNYEVPGHHLEEPSSLRHSRPIEHLRDNHGCTRYPLRGWHQRRHLGDNQQGGGSGPRMRQSCQPDSRRISREPWWTITHPTTILAHERRHVRHRKRPFQGPQDAHSKETAQDRAGRATLSAPGDQGYGRQRKITFLLARIGRLNTTDESTVSSMQRASPLAAIGTPNTTTRARSPLWTSRHGPMPSLRPPIPRLRRPLVRLGRSSETGQRHHQEHKRSPTGMVYNVWCTQRNRNGRWPTIPIVGIR